MPPLLLLALAAPSPPPAIPARLTVNLASYLSDEDYPKEAILNNEQGSVRFRLDVSPTGSVTNCSIIQSSGSRLLDEATCRILTERARFSPARNARGQAITDTVTSTVRWMLPETGRRHTSGSIRGIHNVWEVTADGNERSCRREMIFENGDQLNIAECLPLDRKFVETAAAYLEARPEAILTVRLENRWLVDPVLPFAATPVHRGELLVRGEGDYRLNDDGTVRDCSEGRFSARFNWRPKPCFRTSFKDDVPAGTAGVRMEVQWVVSHGPDTERPSLLPSFARADRATLVPLLVSDPVEKGGASPTLEPAPPPR